MAKYELPDKLQAARVRCSQQRPYLTTLLLRLNPIPVEGLGTLGVDKYARLYFDPKLDWTVPQFATVLYHECCHILRDHAGRGESLNVAVENQTQWNVCGDAEINDDIEAEGGAEWPFQPVMPKVLKQPDGKFAEEYYATLPPPPKSPTVGAGSCGGAAGNPGAHEHGAPSNAGGAKDAPHGIGSAEMEAVKHKVASDVREHAKSRGNVPGWLKDWAQTILEPVTDWRKVLRSEVRRARADIAGMQDFTYQKPSRRASVYPKIIMPSMRQAIPKIAVVIDTSGSMSDDDMAAVLGEVNGVLRQCGQRDGVEAIVCDAEVHSVKRVFSAQQIVLAGRGGTDMRLGITAALAKADKPHAIIVLTDGYTPWPDVPPAGVRVIAALVGLNACKPESVPEWIRAVVVGENK
jgi:predicted metal-dependent peptidase